MSNTWNLQFSVQVALIQTAVSAPYQLVWKGCQSHHGLRSMLHAIIQWCHWSRTKNTTRISTCETLQRPRIMCTAYLIDHSSSFSFRSNLRWMTCYAATQMSMIPCHVCSTTPGQRTTSLALSNFGFNFVWTSHHPISFPLLLESYVICPLIFLTPFNPSFWAHTTIKLFF
jgi:hypothetical protein